MNKRIISKILGIFLFALSLLIALHIPIGFIYHEDGGTLSFLLATLTTALTGALLYFPVRKVDSEITHKEGFLIVTLAWVFVGIFGALPFFFQESFGPMNGTNMINAIFESISGFTTTGATVLNSIEDNPHTILLWRSTTHWLGGMGFIVLSLSMLPFLGVGGFQLYKAEVPGPTQEKIAPRIRETAKILWKVYLIITVVMVIFLLFGGMSLFDAINHSFATLATGGFSTKNKSIESFDSAYIEAVLTVFMVIAGANFSLHYYAIFRGNIKKYFRDLEFRAYILIFLTLSTVAGLSLISSGHPVTYALRHAPFNVASLLTTTGFNSVDFAGADWGRVAQFALILTMFIGGSAGSTGGGVKVIRVILFFKQAAHELYRLIYPKTVNSVKFGGVRIRHTLALNIWGFIFFYFMIIIISAVAIYLSGYDFQTSFYAALACVGNIGPGFGGVGPTHNYAEFAPWIKSMLSFGMLLGRLELYTILVLFSSHFWKNR